jgi:hypothetical protein
MLSRAASAIDADSTDAKSVEAGGAESEKR